MSLTTRIRTAAVTALAVCAVAPMAATAAPAKPVRPTSHPAPMSAYRGGHAAHLRSAASSSLSSLTFSGVCNYFSHQNAFSASVSLNRSRFPNGAWVYAAYQARKTTSSTPMGWTGWYGPVWVNNYQGTTAADVWGPGVPIYGPKSLPIFSYGITAGQFYANVAVAVNTGGSNYETTVSASDSYTEQGQFSMNAGTGSSCWASL